MPAPAGLTQISDAVFLHAMTAKYKLAIIDRELACAPFRSPEGQRYFAAMQCAANMSFANRQVILHRIREVFSATFGRSAEDLGLRMVYDVAHNTAKLETHLFECERREPVGLSGSEFESGSRSPPVPRHGRAGAARRRGL